MPMDVAFSGANLIVLSWKAMLNAVAIAPQKIHTNIIVNIQKAATCINIKDKAVPNTSVNDGSIYETSSIIDSDAELPDNDSYTNTSGKDVVEVNNVSTEIPIWIIVLICVLLAIMIAIPVVFAVFLHMNKKQGLTPKK